MPKSLLDFVRYKFKFEETVLPSKPRKRSKKKNKKEAVKSGSTPPANKKQSVDSEPLTAAISIPKEINHAQLVNQPVPSLVESLESDLPEVDVLLERSSALDVPPAGASKEPAVNLMKEMQDELMAHGISIEPQDDNSTIHPAFRPRSHGRLDRIDLEHDLAELENELHADATNPNDLCSFCDELLPKKPSKMLVDLAKYLKGRPDVCHRFSPTNPKALHLPFSVVADYCRRHQDEISVIPMGLERGWPAQIDFSNLQIRLKTISGHLWSVAHKQIPSEFLDYASTIWKTLGSTKSQSVFYDIDTFKIEQPGYYGPQGFEIIYQTLHKEFLCLNLDLTTQIVHPLAPEYFLRKVLIPEAALGLIAQDFDLPISHPIVRKTLDDSRDFGLAMYPDDQE